MKSIRPVLKYVLIAVAIVSLIHPLPVLSQQPPNTTVSLSDVTLDEDTLRVHFIDIGGGLAALVETPGGKHMLIDGGKKGQDDYETYIDHFVDYENDKIDYLIVTHADDDHFHNMTTIIDYFSVVEYWNTGYTSKTLMKLKRWPKFLQETLPALVEFGAEDWSPIGDYVRAGDLEVIDDNSTSTTADDVLVQYLNVDKQPPRKDPDSNRKFDEGQRRNNASLVFKIIYGDTSILFTGDINGRKKDDNNQESIDSEEKELVDRHNQDSMYNLNATILQVSHHGSNGSSSSPFLREVDPDWAVVPAGKAHGHPTKGAMDRLKSFISPDSHILRTDESGSEAYHSNGNDSTTDETGDDNLIFVIDQNRIKKIHRVRVD